MAYNTGTIRIFMEANKGLVLFTRLPDYFYQCLKYFTEKEDYYLDIIRYRPDAATNFKITETDRIRLIDYENADFNSYLNKDYRFVYSSSWRDKNYKAVCRHYKKSIPVIIGLDNPWQGNFKQKVLSLLSGIHVKPYFNRIWAAGKPQRIYGKKLGFKEEEIAEHLYSCDTDKFYPRPEVKKEFTVLYVGRFVGYKHPVLLAELFIEILQEYPELKKWKLRFAGRGPLKNELEKFQSENIIISDFVDPEYLPLLLNSASVYCLPSTNEHWGVSVHEAVSCGLPILISDTVYSGTIFLEHGKNGYKFQTGSRECFKAKLLEILNQSEDQLKAMGEKSIALSKRISKDVWRDSLNYLINDFRTK
jgi:glycosyltransferase involved in cell wall biosynthesis